MVADGARQGLGDRDVVDQNGDQFALPLDAFHEACVDLLADPGLVDAVGRKDDDHRIRGLEAFLEHLVHEAVAGRISHSSNHTRRSRRPEDARRARARSDRCPRLRGSGRLPGGHGLPRRLRSMASNFSDLSSRRSARGTPGSL